LLSGSVGSRGCCCNISGVGALRRSTAGIGVGVRWTLVPVAIIWWWHGVGWVVGLVPVELTIIAIIRALCSIVVGGRLLIENEDRVVWL